MKLQRKNKYSKKIAVGLLSAVLFANLVGCDDTKAMNEVANEVVIEEIVVDNVEEKYTNFYDITEEEKEKRMEALQIKYPDAVTLLNQVSSFTIKDSEGNYKVIQTLERYNENSDIITYYDLFTEEKLFDLVITEECGYDSSTNLFTNVDFSTIHNEIPYFKDKEIVEYGMCLGTIAFVRNHFNEVCGTNGVYEDYDYSYVFNYLFSENFIDSETYFTVKELADNYVTMVPKAYQVTAEEMGIRPTYREERKYADYWKISNEEKEERMKDVEIVKPLQKFQASVVHTLIFKDKEENIKIMNVYLLSQNNKITFCDLYSGIALFESTINGDIKYTDEGYTGINFNFKENSIPYFEDKEIISIDNAHVSNWYVQLNIGSLRARDNINYEIPDFGCIYYMYPYGSFDLNNLFFSKQEYAECYVVTVPKEMQVATRELTYGFVYDETEKIYKLG